MNERINIADKKPEAKSQDPVPQIRRKTDTYQSMISPVDRIMFLQRTIGNQAVGRLIKSGSWQAKLRIGQPGDIYEQEADRVAEQVMAAPAHPAVSGAPPRIQRFSGQSNGQIDLATTSVEHALASPGMPLEPALRQDMEQRFGHDFSQVRVHSGATAGQSARDVNANAFTVGHNMVFGAGRFDPGTQPGRRLIAHELTHVVQQGNGLHRQLQRQPLGCQQLLATPQVIGRLSGIAVHGLIEGHFLASVPGATTVEIPGAYAGPLRTQGLCGADASMIRPQKIGSTSPRGGVGIPDLARITPGGILQVAEIKPASMECIVDGENQLLGYINQGNAQDQAQVAWRNSLGIKVVAPMLDSAYQPPSLTSGVCQIQTAWCSPGIIVYSVQCQGIPVPQSQEQEQEQEKPAEEPAFRLPRGSVWDKVYAAILTLGALAAVYTLWGKVGALLGLLARAAGITLGLTAGAAAASTSTPGGAGGPPIVKPVPGRVTSQPGGPEHKGSSKAGKAAQKSAADTQAIKVDVIEGVNAERVSVGMVFPVQFYEEGRKQGEEMSGVAILQVTKVVKEETGTTVEFISLQERMTDKKTGGNIGKTSMGGKKIYILTHPYRVSQPPKPGLVGYVINTGPNRQWFWTYLENLANELETAGQKSLAKQVRKEVQRLRLQAAK